MKNIFLCLITALLFQFVKAQNNVGIGTQSPNPNAIVDFNNQGSPLGMLLPRVDITDFSLGAADYGLFVYDSIQFKIYFWDGSGWQEPLLSSGGFVTGAGNTDEIAFWNGASTLNGNASFVWDNVNGRLGIGTTTPQTTFQIEGTGSFFMRMRSTESNSSAYSELEFGRDNGGGGFFKTGGIGTPGSGDYLQISSPQFLRFNTNFSNRMTINNNGNIAIGTGVSSDLLNVNEGNITLYRSDGNDVEITMDGQDNGIDWTIGVEDAAGGDFIISQNSNLSNPKLFVSSGIGVGIGTTSPQAELHIFPASGGNGDIALGTTGSTSYWNMAMTGGNERYILAFNDGSFNDYFIVSNTGNVGLGTTFPINRLDVEGGGAIGAGYAGSFTAPTNGLIIQGNTGIGVSSPLYPLDVSGDAYFRSEVGIGTIPVAGTDLTINSGSFSEISVESSSSSSFSYASAALTLASTNTGSGTPNNNWVLRAGTGGLTVVGQQVLTGMLTFRYEGSLGSRVVAVMSTNHFGPYSNAGIDLGNSSFRWNRIYYTTGILGTSDRKYKNNISTINYGIDEIMQLNPVSFKWNEFPEQGTQLGLIAQEVREVLPEVVVESDGEEKDLMMNHLELIPVMIKAIQELKTENDNLKKMILENDNK